MTQKTRTELINSAESLAAAIEKLWRSEPAFTSIFQHERIAGIINRTNASNWAIYRVEVERTRCVKPGVNITFGDDTRIEATLILYGQGLLEDRLWTPDRISILVNATITKNHCHLEVTTARLLYPEVNNAIVTNTATA